MTRGSEDTTRARLSQRLQSSPECIPVDHFGQPLGEADRQHLAMCTRCQAEFALWRSITDPAPRTDDDFAPRVAAEIERRLPWSGHTHGTARRDWRSGLQRRSLAAAAILLALTAGYVAWDPEPSVDEAASVEEGYRSGIRVVAPTGELDRAPNELTWIAVQGDVRYDVRVLEVDGTLVWSTTSSSSSVDLPTGVKADFLPGKTLVWDVTARNSASGAVAYSGTQHVRVRVVSPRSR
jgi:hypothetical protein